MFKLDDRFLAVV